MPCTPPSAARPTVDPRAPGRPAQGDRPQPTRRRGRPAARPCSRRSIGLSSTFWSSVGASRPNSPPKPTPTHQRPTSGPMSAASTAGSGRRRPAPAAIRPAWPPSPAARAAHRPADRPARSATGSLDNSDSPKPRLAPNDAAADGRRPVGAVGLEEAGPQEAGGGPQRLPEHDAARRLAIGHQLEAARRIEQAGQQHPVARPQGQAHQRGARRCRGRRSPRAGAAAGPAPARPRPRPARR